MKKLLNSLFLTNTGRIIFAFLIIGVCQLITSVWEMELSTKSYNNILNFQWVGVVIIGAHFIYMMYFVIKNQIESWKER